ncbi:biotin transporter BioY [Oceanirhabdus seepicola]|uniref:Biotin transporter n=1 Tax=Oceanirhabdus seepicola TaxID=2828781 RepID=A0A9J6P9F9_9CLOT|nr:biotin transporter BioY [Oceanirhabdus seepicola]MCM1992566.1 biotin transporter BioY [Oceanirhabdus seepicola]
MKISTKDMILVALFAALTAIGAYITIPIPTVPITLQFLFCAFAGIILGSKLGALSQIIYVLIGLAGVPVFAGGGGGIGYVYKPSFGYLIGFILTAFIIGYLREKMGEINVIKAFIISVLGLVATYMIGVPYLHYALNNFSNVPMTWGGAIKIGIVPFVLGDLIKCFIVAAIAPTVVKTLKRERIIK